MNFILVHVTVWVTMEGGEYKQKCISPVAILGLLEHISIFFFLNSILITRGITFFKKGEIFVSYG